MRVSRGDIYYVKNFEHYNGYKCASRPCIIVSNDANNATADSVEVVFLTSRKPKRYPTHADVSCTVPSVALCEHICTVSKDKLGTFVKRATDMEMSEIDRCVAISLGFALDKAIEPVPPEDDGVVTDQDVIVEMIRLEAERDTYKEMYEDLLEKVIK